MLLELLVPHTHRVHWLLLCLGVLMRPKLYPVTTTPAQVFTDKFPIMLDTNRNVTGHPLCVAGSIVKEFHGKVGMESLSSLSVRLGDRDSC